jgi:hypothetical protein
LLKTNQSYTKVLCSQLKGGKITTLLKKQQQRITLAMSATNRKQSLIIVVGFQTLPIVEL